MPGLGLISSTDTSRTQGYYHTDASGETVATYEYDAFGALRNQTGTASGVFRFTGEQLDTTGLYFLRARYYDPATGRFLSRDPFPGYSEDPRTLNPYSYVGNDPVNATDPSGMDWFDPIDSGTPGGGGGGGGEVKIPSPPTPKQAASGAVNGVKALARGTGSGVRWLWRNTVGRSGNTARPSEYEGPATVSWSRVSGMLRSAAEGKGNFGLGRATKVEADAAGKAWVGPGHRIASDGKTLISSDGLRQYRPPSYKPKLGREQANLEWRTTEVKQWQGNGHIDIVP